MPAGLTIAMILGGLAGGTQSFLGARKQERDADRNFQDALATLRNSPYTRRQASFAGTTRPDVLQNTIGGVLGGVSQGASLFNTFQGAKTGDIATNAIGQANGSLNAGEVQPLGNGRQLQLNNDFQNEMIEFIKLKQLGIIK